MAVSHICPGCGFDLARIRPVRDADLGVAVVTCLGCGRASVRRRHPMQARWRRARRTLWALFLLGVQLGLLTVFTVLTFVAMEHMVEEMLPRFGDYHLASVLAIPVVVPILLGAWLTAGLPHWNRLAAYGAWVGWMVALLVIGALFISIDDYVGVAWIARPSLSVSGYIKEGLLDAELLAWIVLRLVYLPWQLLAAAAGWPLGAGVLWAGRNAGRAVRRARRRARRNEVSR